MDASSLARVGFGVALVALSGAVAWSAYRRAERGVLPTPLLALAPPSLAVSYTWRNRIVHPTIRHESGGRYDAINQNTDGAGISVGLLSWAQSVGGLRELSDAMWAKDPSRMLAIFGPSAKRMVDQLALPGSTSAAKAARLAPIDGAVLWTDPWLTRWRTALNDPTFRAVQDDLVLNGSYMRATLKASATLGGTPTERGMALVFDRAVQQGTGAVAKFASRAVALTPGADFDTRARKLADLAAEAWPANAADVRRRTADILSSSLVLDAPVA